MLRPAGNRHWNRISLELRSSHTRRHQWHAPTGTQQRPNPAMHIVCCERYEGHVRVLFALWNLASAKEKTWVIAFGAWALALGARCTEALQHARTQYSRGAHVTANYTGGA